MQGIENFEENQQISVAQQLEDAGIDVSNWGKGGAKTIEHLQREIDSGEAELVTNEQGELLRKVTIGQADVFYISPEGKKFYLKEEKQIFKDGRKRERELDPSIAEKMKPDESPAEAIERGIREELGVEGELEIKQIGVDEEINESPSFPGLKSQYSLYKFEAMFNDDQFNPDGYIEEQEDKNTYFVWEELDENGDDN